MTCGPPPLRVRFLAMTAEIRVTSSGTTDALLAQAFEAMRADPAKAVALADRAARSAADDRLVRRAALARAQGLLIQGAFEEALLACEAGLRAKGSDEDAAKDTLDLRNTRFHALLHLDRVEDAQAAGEALLGDCEDDARRTCWVLMNLADLAFRQDHPREALTYYHRAARLLDEDAAPTFRAALAANRANALEAVNRFRAAERHFAIARSLLDEEAHAHTRAQVTYNAAFLSFLRGRYADALAGFRQAEPVFEQVGDRRHLAHIALDRAEAHLAMGLPQEAQTHASSAASAFEALGLTKELGQATLLRARASEKVADASAASAHYARASRVFASLGLLERSTACQAQQGRIALEAGDLSQALAHVDAASDRLPVQANPLTRALLAFLRARIALEEGDPARALALVDVALFVCRRIEAAWTRLEGEWIRARAHRALGDDDSAVRAYHEAIETLERFRVGVPPDEYMTAFLSEHAVLYEEVVDLLAERDALGDAFRYTERAKSRALVDLLASRHHDASPRDAVDVTMRVRHLRERLHALYCRLNRDDGDAARSARTIRQARAEAERMESEVARLVRDSHHRESATLEAVSAPDLGAVQEDLDTETTLLEYLHTGTSLVVFVVTRDAAHVVRTVVPDDHVRMCLQRFQFHCAQFERGSVPNEALALAATRTNLSKLADVLLPPDVRKHLGTQRLVIVPHGVLHHVPFHALPWGDGWLSDEFRITYTPSAAVYGFCRREARDTTPLLSVLGLPDDVAPQIAGEAHAIAALLDDAHVYLDGAATFERLKRECGRARVLHVATHGMFRRGQPTMSAIRLADRWVNLYDVYTLNVASDLVVLSTCESGTAGVSNGNEILGLTRGFLFAGAPALLTSQWRVHDAATAQFMQCFYKAVCQDSDVEGAVRTAMQQVRASRPHPYYWAAFFLLGRPRPLELKPAAPSLNPRPEECAP